MNQKITIGISDWNICKSNDVLCTYALGSCVGICLYDKITSIAGLSHIMLPDSKAITNEAVTNRMKFADTAIVDMYKKMISMGAVSSRITAKIAGGAVMFATTSNKFNIGERNIIAVKAALAALRIPIIAQDCGSNYGRTVFFYAEDGKVEIKSTIKGINIL